MTDTAEIKAEEEKVKVVEEEKKGDSDLSKYITDPKKDGVDAKFVEVEKDPDLEEVPIEFEEEVSGPPPTPAEVVKIEALKKKEVADAKQETKLDEAERYKKILEGLGFVLQKVREEGKVQYTLEYGELRIGRTFTEGFPTGKFWARKDGNFIDSVDVKELDIVKAFYDVRDGKKSIEDVTAKVMLTPAPTPISPPASAVTSGGNVTPYKKDPEIKRQIGSMKLEKKGGYYKVGGHDEPDAALVQQYANDAGVNLKIIIAEQDEISAKAVIRAMLNGQTVDAVVIHYFDTSRDVIALEVIESMQRKRMKPIESYRDDGRPILSQETNYRIYKRFIRFQNFGIRDAVTKASRIATLKLLNKEWRDQEEIEAETAEVRSVGSGDDL